MATSIIPNTDYKIQQINSAKRLGYFFSAADLDELLNWKLETMENNTWRSISVEAKATFGVFVNTYIYHGFLFRSGSTNYAHVILYPNASTDVITGQYSTSQAGSWTYDKLTKPNDVSSMMTSVIGSMQVYTKTIPANGGTATIRASATTPCLIFTSYSNTSATFSGHYASILATGAPAYMPLFTPGSNVTFSAASGGGLTVTNNHTAGISLIVIRLMGTADVTITTASA